MEKYSKITFRDSFKAANFFQIYLAHPVYLSLPAPQMDFIFSNLFAGSALY
jgi:hypothetical protein